MSGSSSSISVILDSQNEATSSNESLECGQRLSSPNVTLKEVSSNSSNLYSPWPSCTSTPNQTRRPKRTMFSDSISPVTENTRIPKKRRPEKSTMADVCEKLKALPYINDISIMNFAKTYKTDPLVTEYADTLLQLPHCCPIMPTEDLLFEHAETQLNFIVPNDLYVHITTNFISYCQLSYFKNNVVNATAEGKTMFNPKCDFFIPQFPLVPEQTLNDMTRAKKALVFHFQDYAVQGAQFTRELLLIRNFKAITSFLTESGITDTDIQCQMKHIFAKGYIRAKLEFVAQYNVKFIDWKKREDKVRHTLPFWRSQTIKVPPIQPFNRFAVSLAENIKASKVSFVSEDLKTEYTNFFHKSEAIVDNMRSAVQSRIQPSSVNGQTSSIPQQTDPQAIRSNTRGQSAKSAFSIRGISRRGQPRSGNFQGRGQRPPIHNSYRGITQPNKFKTRGMTRPYNNKNKTRESNGPEVNQLLD